MFSSFKPLVCFILLHTLIWAEPLTLILNMENSNQLPSHFRSVTDALHFGFLESTPSTEGLAELRASGSGQFSKESLGAIIKRLDTPNLCTIVDLRQESHGFLNGAAISWFAPRNWANKGKSPEQIMEIEANLLEELHNKPEAIVSKIVKKNPQGGILASTQFNMPVESTDTEKSITTASQIEYLRLPVADHMAPSDEIVEAFVQFIAQLPSNCWLHFHCEAGEGRTTTFLAMYDMIRNAKKVSVDEILQRQWLLGGSNLKNLPDLSAWNFDYYLARLLFLKQFYEYCKSNQDNFKTLWGTYKEKNNVSP